MDKNIKIRVCVGTHCYVMGNYDLKDIKNKLPDDLRDKVYVEGAVCLGCDVMKKKPQHPYVEINGELMAGATLQLIIDRLRSIEMKKTKNNIL